jgi:hypothetical protein
MNQYNLPRTIVLKRILTTFLLNDYIRVSY